jgi:hypothetical protein
MRTILEAIPCDDQPIDGATLMGNTKPLTSWVDTDSPEIQEEHRQLTEGIPTQKERISVLWNFVKNIPYTRFVKTRISVDGRTFIQPDTWLEPAQALLVGKLNCFNKSTLLASLLCQELPSEQVWVCLNNVNVDGIDGHAVTYLRLGDDYILETTNPGIKSPFMPASSGQIYEGVVWFNDKDVFCIPGPQLRQPLGTCCIRWLEDYVNERLCDAFI